MTMQEALHDTDKSSSPIELKKCLLLYSGGNLIDYHVYMVFLPYQNHSCLSLSTNFSLAESESRISCLLAVLFADVSVGMRRIIYTASLEAPRTVKLLRPSSTVLRHVELSPHKILTLQVKADEELMLPTMTILSSGLETIWSNRQVKKGTTLFNTRIELECAVSIKRRSKKEKLDKQGMYAKHD